MRHVSVLLMVLLPLGCASVRHADYKVTGNKVADVAESKDLGIRYYQAAPYLIIIPDGKGSYSADIHWMPDQSRVFTARPEQLLAKLHTTFKFENGVLTSMASEEDSTAVAGAFLEQAKTLIPKLAQAASLLNDPQAKASPVPVEVQPEYTVPAPYIVKLVYRDGKLSLDDVQGDEGFKITISPEPKKS